MICNNMRQYLLHLFNGNLFKYPNNTMYVETGVGAFAWYGYYVHVHPHKGHEVRVEAIHRPFPKGSDITYVMINKDILWGQIP